MLQPGLVIHLFACDCCPFLLHAWFFTNTGKVLHSSRRVGFRGSYLTPQNYALLNFCKFCTCGSVMIYDSFMHPDVYWNIEVFFYQHFGIMRPFARRFESGHFFYWGLNLFVECYKWTFESLCLVVHKLDVLEHTIFITWKFGIDHNH